MTDRERLLEDLRPVAFAIAYRMLGSVSEAEDVVQEALLRVNQALDGGEQIASPRAFLTTVTTRLAINELRSARARRERYVGEWLPEPIITDGRDDPARHAETADSLSLAMLVLLESLSPEQRAVLLLHDVFDYPYPEIAVIVGKSEDNVRQLATRARRHVEQRRGGLVRFQTTREQRDELARRFFAAAEQGDLAGLESLLAADVMLTGDGGGKVPALARSLHGRNRVARTLTNWLRRVARVPGSALRPVEVNGGAGALVLDPQQRLISVWALDIADGQITSVSSIVNPDKLAHLGPVGDFRSLLKPARPRSTRPRREPTRGTIRRDDGPTIAYDVAGHGPLVVFVHGLTSFRQTWDPVTQLLAEELTCVRLDLRGHGASSRAAEYSMVSLVGDVRAVVEEVALGEPAIVGHSLGASIAAVYAATHGARAVVCVDQSLRFGEFAGLVQAHADDLRSQRTMEAVLSIDRALELEPYAEVENIERRVLAFPREVVLGTWDALLSTPPEQLTAIAEAILPRIAAPLLSLHGSPPLPDYADWLTGLARGARVEIWDGTGHMLHLVDPERFAARVRSLLADQSH